MGKAHEKARLLFVVDLDPSAGDSLCAEESVMNIKSADLMLIA